MLCPPLFAANSRYAFRFGQAWGAGPKPGHMVGVVYWLTMLEAADYRAAMASEFGHDLLLPDWAVALYFVSQAQHLSIAAIANVLERRR